VCGGETASTQDSPSGYFPAVRATAFAGARPPQSALTWRRAPQLDLTNLSRMTWLNCTSLRFFGHVCVVPAPKPME